MPTELILSNKTTFSKGLLHRISPEDSDLFMGCMKQSTILDIKIKSLICSKLELVGMPYYE
jgi:hypothetical protein